MSLDSPQPSSLTSAHPTPFHHHLLTLPSHPPTLPCLPAHPMPTHHPRFPNPLPGYTQSCPVPVNKGTTRTKP
ncbi:hypothetical protein E2C01_096154 [Portunus trituberculatus]|uniref:Uncharacterized protein n=1 Tax=Portunus trituberculatus TaxID=210409 RepID=A0A5B7K1B5_PORTR|nr:hypothetical protein [Portunus trituberculatus]